MLVVGRVNTSSKCTGLEEKARAIVAHTYLTE